MKHFCSRAGLGSQRPAALLAGQSNVEMPLGNLDNYARCYRSSPVKDASVKNAGQCDIACVLVKKSEVNDPALPGEASNRYGEYGIFQLAFIPALTGEVFCRIFVEKSGGPPRF